MRRAPKLLLILLLVPSLGARCIQGPVVGVVAASDGAAIDDLVVRLRCAGNVLHGASTSDTETRIVSSGERFRFAWAWGGLSPAGCSVEINHPLYLTAAVPVGDAFSSDLGTIQLQSWDQFLRAGPTDPPAHTAYPWPVMELQQHLFTTDFYFVAAHPEPSRAKLAIYVPSLHQIFDRAVHALSTSWHDDSPWTAELREHLRQIEAKTGWTRPAPQAELADAAKRGDAERVRVLLAAGVDREAWGPDGAAPLHLAAAEGHLEAVRALLDGGATVDREREGAGDTPLLEATQQHRVEVALLLLERGADPAYAAWRGTALAATAWQNAPLELVDALIAHGAIANARDEQHVVYALLGAASNGHVAILERLLAAGVAADASVAPHDPTALMAAALRGREQAVELLIRAGADVNAHTNDGTTALTQARKGPHERVIALLEKAGAREPSPPAEVAPRE